MPRLIVAEGNVSQRRQIAERISELEKEGYPLYGKFEAGEVFKSWRGLFEAAGGRGLFAERQVIVAEEADALGPFPDELAEYIEDPGDGAAQSVIIAVFAGDTKKVFPKAAQAKKKIVFLKKEADVPPWKRKEWLMSLARTNGAVLAPDAAALLGESIESTEELRGELSKLSLCAGGREITVGDVRALSFDEGAGAMLCFLDGVCQAKPQDVAKALKHLRDEPLLPVLAALCNRLRPAMFMAVFPKSTEAALRALGMGQGKDYALRMARSALSLFGAKAVENFMLRAARLSFVEKTSVSEGWPGFEIILWELMGCAKKRR